MTNEINVYDPPMCCSSGVCGPSVNPALVRFASDLEFLKQNGVSVKRHNLSSEPSAFVAEPIVKETLIQDGNVCLPLILLNGKLIGKGRYPAREELLQSIGLNNSAKELSQAKRSDCGSGCSCNGSTEEPRS